MPKKLVQLGEQLASPQLTEIVDLVEKRGFNSIVSILQNNTLLLLPKPIATIVFMDSLEAVL